MINCLYSFNLKKQTNNQKWLQDVLPEEEFPVKEEPSDDEKEFPVKEELPEEELFEEDVKQEKSASKDPKVKFSGNPIFFLKKSLSKNPPPFFFLIWIEDLQIFWLRNCFVGV